MLLCGAPVLAPALRAAQLRAPAAASARGGAAAHTPQGLAGSARLACRRRDAGRHACAARAAKTVAAAAEVAGAAEVDRISGVRLVPLEGQKAMRVEYRIKWKDDAPDSWEPARNVAEDVLREFESRWWGAARKGDVAEVTDMLGGGREVLATTVDDNGRTALHYACGIGSEACVTLLLDNGADVSAGDKDGYTPLHIAAGYLNRGVVRLLLAAGADPELSDRQGRSALDLVVSIKQNTPTTPDFFARRGALDDVVKELETHLFEELEPLAVLAKRGTAAAEGMGPLEYLVQWSDGSENTWEPERNLADDVIADFEAGLEYASATRIRDRRRGAVTEYLVEWDDGAEPTWEPEDRISDEVMREYLDRVQPKKQRNSRASSDKGSALVTASA